MRFSLKSWSDVNLLKNRLSLTAGLCHWRALGCETEDCCVVSMDNTPVQSPLNSKIAEMNFMQSAHSLSSCCQQSCSAKVVVLFLWDHGHWITAEELGVSIFTGNVMVYISQSSDWWKWSSTGRMLGFVSVAVTMVTLLLALKMF